MSKFSDGVRTYEWKGPLTDMTLVTVTVLGRKPDPPRMFGTLVSMSQGEVLIRFADAGFLPGVEGR